MDKIAITFHGKDSKITSATVKKILKLDHIGECRVVDNINMLQSLLLKQLPQERISGVINLWSALTGGLREKNLENALVR